LAPPRTVRELTLFSKIQGAKPALLGPMSWDQGNTLTHTLVAEPYSLVQVRMGALQAVIRSFSGTPAWISSPNRSVQNV